MVDLIHTLEMMHLLREEDIEIIKNAFNTEEYVAGDIFLPTGRIARHIFFLSKGYVKGFHYNEKGKVTVDHLIEPSNFFTAFESLSQNQASLDDYIAVSDCLVYKISTSDFAELRASNAAFNAISQQVIQASLSCKIERLRDFQTLTAKERYLKLMQERPNLLHNISINDIASYLGIEPQSLSRIRKQVLI